MFCQRVREELIVTKAKTSPKRFLGRERVRKSGELVVKEGRAESGGGMEKGGKGKKVDVDGVRAERRQAEVLATCQPGAATR